MKKINTTPITATVGLPIKSGTLNHLQEAHQETVAELARALIGETYSTAAFYKLRGCVNSGSGSNFIISAGSIFHNGEVYLVDAATFTAGGGETAVGTITTSNVVAANADPVLLTNSTTANVHEVRKIVFASGVAGSGDVDFWDLVQYIQSEHYDDISDDVTLDGALTPVHKEIRRYSDGTVLVNIVATYSGNIAANTNLVTGLPTGSTFYAINSLEYSNSPYNVSVSHLIHLSLTGIIVNIATITHGTNDTLAIYFTYKTF